MSILSRRSVASAAVLIALAATTGRAQKFDEAKSCDKAARIVEKGHPEKKLAGAFLTLNVCGAAGASALATGLLTYTQETDPVALQDFMQFVDAWRDSTIFAAATQLATNSAASPAARVFGVRHLLVLTHPFNRYTFAGLTRLDTVITLADSSQLTTAGCGGGIGSEAGDRVGTPLPADFESRIQATLAALVAAPETPAIVRAAARCGS